MAAFIHFTALVGLAILAVFVACRFYERPTVVRTVAAVVVPLFLGLAVAVLGIHACDRGQPLTQWLVPGIALCAVLLLVGKKLVRFGVAALLTVAMVALTLHYGALVHGEEWLGRAGPVMSGEHASFEWHTGVTGLYRTDH